MKIIITLLAATLLTGCAGTPTKAEPVYGKLNCAQLRVHQARIIGQMGQGTLDLKSNNPFVVMYRAEKQMGRSRIHSAINSFMLAKGCYNRK